MFSKLKQKLEGTDSKQLGVTDSKQLGVTDSKQLGDTDIKQLGRDTDSKQLGDTDSKQLGVTDSKQMGDTDSKQLGLTASKQLGLLGMFGAELKHEEFLLDRDHVFLNHGSYGTVPKRVIREQRRLQSTMERHPDNWYRRINPQLHISSLQALCQFIGAEVADTVFVENVTNGLNTILRSLTWKRGDAILVTNLSYHSVNIMSNQFAETVRLDLSFPVQSSELILGQYEKILQERPGIQLAVIDHITSPSSVVMPVKRLAALCHSYNVKVVVDGAHAAGQIPLKVQQLGVDFYAGNVHKWLFTPRGCGYLWVNPDYRNVIKPVVISHFHGFGLHYDFCVRDTRDSTPYHTVPEAIKFHEALGGWF